ncbi:response regulator transcription factor [Aquibacillus kalidii]|uniref:response regulator transcription factor n=1 Tax=Aquibacillus kalidii TaxID=2762597 RepID=UPI0016459603|nr:response regulator transcription factor [Aquibacillus kalidii]
MEEAKLLIIDDEYAILHMLKTILNKELFTNIDTASTRAEAIRLCKDREYDLILLDVMLPDGDGFEICPVIRGFTDATIFFLTARTTDLDKLSGFAVGADDYITKPFNPLEVVARIKAHLRRKSSNPVHVQQDIYHYGDIVVNTKAAEVNVKGIHIDLPAQVYQLLLFFCKHPNQVFSKHQLYESVWGEEFIDEDNTVMVHIRKLREKIEEAPGNPNYIVTVRGLGYKFVPGRERV